MIELIKKYYKRILIALLIVVSSAFLMVNLLSQNGQDQNMRTARELVPVEPSLITKQTLLLEKFTSEGYSPENPNIIVDPMGNAPLTALMIFETDKAAAPEIEVMGKILQAV